MKTLITILLLLGLCRLTLHRTDRYGIPETTSIPLASITNIVVLILLWIGGWH